LIQGSAPANAAAAANPAVCPYLGLVDDPRTHFAFATTAHRCHSGAHPEPIEVSHQGALCLSADYAACQRYVLPTAVGAGLAVAPRPAEAPIAHVGTRVRWRSGPDGRRRLVVRAGVVLVAVLTLAIFAAVILGQGGFKFGGPAGVAGSSPTTSLASPAASPTASLASPTGSPQPTPTASSAPTSGPTASPTGSVAALPTTHIVRRGETLTSIARLYGVTLAALEKANGIKDPSLITVGQRLIIPAH
jgi:LysM repeat protein